MHDFATRLKEYRLQNGFSLFQLAQRSGIDRAGLWRMEQGIHRPKPENLQRLSRALEVPYGELLRAAGYPEAELPPLRPYLRAQLGMSELEAVEIEHYIAEHYGTSAGPRAGEDEIDDEHIKYYD